MYGFQQIKKSRDFSSKRNGLANQNLAFFYTSSRIKVWICQEKCVYLHKEKQLIFSYMNDFEAIVVIVLVALVLKPILKGIFGWFGESDYRRDR